MTSSTASGKGTPWLSMAFTGELSIGVKRHENTPLNVLEKELPIMEK
jgi:hypothetical protein